MLVKLYAKSVYGKLLRYPINYTAKIFSIIAGTKTLSKQDVLNIRLLGYSIEYDYPMPDAEIEDQLKSAPTG